MNHLQHIAYISSLPHGLALDIEKEAKDNSSISFKKYCITSPRMLPSLVRELAEEYNGGLSVILDYCSFRQEKQKTKKEKKKEDICYKGITDSILRFPEVNFFFDESHIPSNGDYKSFIEYLSLRTPLYDSSFPQGSVNTSYHTYESIKDILARDNLYDASNLRYCLREAKLARLFLNNNYQQKNKSRAEHLALCVEEDREQSMFNSVSLYLNGFRVLPVRSADALQWVNEHINNFSLIVRDYDLQFSDQPEDEEEIDLLRGWKDKDKDKDDEKNKENKDQCQDQLVKCLDKDNNYWNKLLEVPCVYVSKGFKDIRFISPKERDRLDKIKSFLLKKGLIKKKADYLELTGMYKPISSLYWSFQNIPIVKDCYRYSRDAGEFTLKRTNKKGHGIPLELYDIVSDMVNRVEQYYKSGQSILATVLAEEAILLMDGFHRPLALKAYYYQALAENSIAVDVLGGREEELEKDTKIRIKKIKEDVARLSWVAEVRPRENYLRRRNILNQIFSDCRQYCKEKEHFKAEEVFISEMAHLNEGIFRY